MKNQITLTSEQIAKMQSIVDDLKKESQYKKYVSEKKLHLIDSNLLIYDHLLSVGILK